MLTQLPPCAPRREPMGPRSYRQSPRELRDFCFPQRLTGRAEGGGPWVLGERKKKTMKPKPKILKQWAVALCVAFIATAAQAVDKKPNILFIMGDDVGWFNVEPYHQGIMSGKTPNLMRLAKEGMRFTDYYAEASCTAG